MELHEQLSALQTELKGFVEKAAAEKKEFGTMQSDTKSALEKLQKQLDAVDVKLAEKHNSGAAEKPLEEELKENEDVARLLKNRSGRATISVKSNRFFNRKTTISDSAVGFQTTGVLTIDRIQGITPEARQDLTVRDLLVARPTNLALVDFVKVTVAPAAGTMTAEANAITENAVTFATSSEKVRTIATFIPATKQILDDFSELAGYINTSLPYYVNLEEELQLLSGDATGENLHGLVTQAAAYSLLQNVAGDNYIDQIGHAITQLAVAKELKPTFVVLNVADWWKIRLTKDQYGRYILGDPQSNVQPTLFGLTVVPTTSMTAAHFLVGTGAAPAAEIRDRMEMQVEISTEHADFFQRNMVAIRAEKRVALVVKRPNAFVAGAFV